MNPILTSGLANIINSFTTQFETYFNSNFLTLLSSEVGSYYGVLGAGLMFFLIVNGALFALREKNRKRFTSSDNEVRTSIPNTHIRLLHNTCG